MRLCFPEPLGPRSTGVTRGPKLKCCPACLQINSASAPSLLQSHSARGNPLCSLCGGHPWCPQRPLSLQTGPGLEHHRVRQWHSGSHCTGRLSDDGQPATLSPSPPGGSHFSEPGFRDRAGGRNGVSFSGLLLPST